MSQVLWHTQMSLDGFIAGPGDTIEWAFEDWSDTDEPDETIDEVPVHLTPVLLGDGVRLFSRPGGSPVRLERTSVRGTGQLTALRFRVRRDGRHQGPWPPPPSRAGRAPWRTAATSAVSGRVSAAHASLGA